VAYRLGGAIGATFPGYKYCGKINIYDKKFDAQEILNYSAK
jgi:hypothetical protein